MLQFHFSNCFIRQTPIKENIYWNQDFELAIKIWSFEQTVQDWSYYNIEINNTLNVTLQLVIIGVNDIFASGLRTLIIKVFVDSLFSVNC